MKSQNKITRSVALFFAPDFYEEVKIFDDLMESAFSFSLLFIAGARRGQEKLLTIHLQPCWAGRAQSAAAGAL